MANVYGYEVGEKEQQKLHAVCCFFAVLWTTILILFAAL